MIEQINRKVIASALERVQRTDLSGNGLHTPSTPTTDESTPVVLSVNYHLLETR